MRKHLISWLTALWLSAVGGMVLGQTVDPAGVSRTLGLSESDTISGSAASQPAVLQPAMPAVVLPPAHSPPAKLSPQPAPLFDYGVNLRSEVFGAQLFTGAFARQGTTQFNPDYALAIGDRVQVRLWGAFNFDQMLIVDPKGNLFLPHVGPVRVLGVRNRDLQRVVESAIAGTFRNNVQSYASLAAAQPVRVFVGGYVNRPGLFSGTSMDSLLHYLDQAGGIDPERGSFLRVEVKRGPDVRVAVNLYDFLLEGTMPLVQLSDGDVIFVPPRHGTVRVGGLAANAKRFEFGEGRSTLGHLSRLARPDPSATHVRITRNRGPVRTVDYLLLQDADAVVLNDGDEIEYAADKKAGTITIRLDGEHLSGEQHVLPYGARLSDLLQRVRFSDRSDSANLQLFRLSVKQRQKQLLAASLKSLEAAALTARSGTSDEARLRAQEADLVLKWIDRARAIEPSGQIVMSTAAMRDTLLLEDGDVLRVPARDGLVLISGEVLFPSAIVHDNASTLDDYIRRSGGYTQNADAARVVVVHRDGSATEVDRRSRLFGPVPLDLAVREGDEILVLPKIDVKSMQIFKDLTQIVYQIAVSAKVVLGL